MKLIKITEEEYLAHHDNRKMTIASGRHYLPYYFGKQDRNSLTFGAYGDFHRLIFSNEEKHTVLKIWKQKNVQEDDTTVTLVAQLQKHILLEKLKCVDA